MALAFGLHSLGGLSTSVGSTTSGSVSIQASAGQNIAIGTATSAGVQIGTSGTNGVVIGNTSCGITLAPNSTNIYGAGALILNHSTSMNGAQLLCRSAAFTQFSLGTAGNAVFNVDGNGQTSVAMGTTTSSGVVSSVANTNTTSTASGAGASDLIAYTLPANALSAVAKGVRIKAWGTTANNANAKTVALLFGGTTLISKQLTVSIAGFWEIEAVVFKTGASAQSFEAKATNSGGTTVSSADGATVLMQMNVTTSTETDTANIIIKGRATAATSASDIVQKGMLVEFFN